MLNRTSKILAYKRFYIMALVLFALDQCSKLWVLQAIEPYTYIDPPPIPVIAGFLYWVHIYNEGAAWGILSGYGLWLAALGLLTLTAIFFLRKELELKRHGIQYAIGLLCGGIIGNLFDRIAYGHVIDFIDIHLPGYRWPAFNVADCGITVGVSLYITLNISDFFKKSPATPEESPSPK